MEDETRTEAQLINRLARLRRKAVRLNQEIAECYLAGKSAKEQRGRLDFQPDNLLFPERQFNRENVGEFVDFQTIQELLDRFYKITKVGVAILDLQGNVLVATGWQDICTKFHRIHPHTSRNCFESDVFLSRNVEQGKYILYKCKNNMWDMSTPIVAGDTHIANLFLGQFFFEDEVPDYEVFSNQAKMYGFDESEYLAALERVPRWSRETVQNVMDFYTRLAGIISRLSYGNMELVRLLSEQKQTEKVLRASEMKYRIVADNTHDWEHWIDPEGQFLYTSPSCERITGYSAGEFEADPMLLSRIVHPDDLSTFAAHLEQNQSPNALCDMELRIVHRDGTMRWIGHVCQPVFDAEGNFLGRRGGNRDITKRKRSEEALKHSEASYRALAENLPGIVYRSSVQEQRIQFFNNFVKDITGHEPDALSFQDFCVLDSLILPEDRKEVINIVKTAVDKRRDFQIEYRIKHKDGTVRNCLERGRPIYGADGRLLHIEGVIFDNTDKKQIETQLRQAQKLEAIGTLAGGISHDFNNLLATILVYTEMALRDMPDASPTRGDLQQVVSLVHRGRDLVKQIVFFSRQRDEEKKHAIIISSLLKETLKLLRASLPFTIDIQQEITVKEDAALLEPTQFHQVLINLCSNAAHAMGEKGGVLQVGLFRVELDARSAMLYTNLKPGPYLKLSVSDTGCGMDADTLQRIFDPYFTTKGPEEGTGLGLAVVHGIVERHGGAIKAYSTPGKGSTFHVLFPAIESHPEMSFESETNIPRGTERILLVDHEEALLLGYKKNLERLGYSIVEEKDSLEALAVFESQPQDFDLVITDYTMPKMTGLDLAREILRSRPDTPVVLCTGSRPEDIHENAKAAGIRGVVMKPLALRELAIIVREVLNTR